MRRIRKKKYLENDEKNECEIFHATTSSSFGKRRRRRRKEQEVYRMKIVIRGQLPARLC